MSSSSQSPSIASAGAGAPPVTEAERAAVAQPALKSATRKSRVRPYLILGIVVAVAVLAFAVIRFLGRDQESTDDAQIDADAVSVAARVGGAVLRVLVADNQLVKKGDLLVEIDPADLRARAAQARADLAAAQAQAQSADAQVAIVEATSRGGLSAAQAQLFGTATSVASADAQVESARAAVVRAKADASRADTDLARAEALLKDQAVPQAQVDTARSGAAAAHAAVAQAEAQLAAAQDMKRTAESHIAEARGRVQQSAPIDAQLAAARANADLAHARVDAAQAGVALAELNLSYTKVEAPADGYLSRLAVRPGQLLAVGQPIVVLVPNATYVIANFKETQVGAMRAGQRATITVDAFPGRKFEGTVESTSPGTGARFSMLPPDNASGNFVKVVQRVPVKIVWTQVPPDVKLSAGLSTDVTVYTR